MAEADFNADLSEIKKPTENTILIQAASDLCCALQPFFDLAEREVREHNNTDWICMEYLLKSAKAEVWRFSELVEKSAAAA
ncbi:MAG: hypothetical protein ACYC3O_03300 [Burkholderiales bacterium]